MRRRSSLRTFILVLLAAITTVALAQPTFRIAIGVDPDTLDPLQGTTTTVDNIIDYVAETLTTINSDGELIPGLATSWEVAADGLSWTFHLREGVSFQDGTPFNADAVVWNIDRLLDPDVRVPRRGSFSAIESAEAVDANTVKMNLSEPAPYLPGAMTVSTLAILSPASVDADGNSYQNITHPVGTGPYAFTSRSLGEKVVVDRNDSYWGEKPYYQEVVFQIVPEATTRESLLLAGQADLIILPPTSDLPALTANPRTTVFMGPSDRTIFIVINNNDPVLKDKRVRQALNYAVDKQAIIDGILFGAAVEMDAPMSSALFGYSPIGAYPYDPEKAKELLAEAGVAPGSLTLDFMSPTGRYVQDFPASQAIANYLADVGITANVRTMDWPSYIATITAAPAENKTQLHFLGWAPSYMDASQQMQQFDATQWPPGGLATSFYDDPATQKLIEAANTEVDAVKRADIYAQASKLIWDDAPWIFLWVQSFPMAYDSNLTGVSGLPNEKFYAIYARPK